MDENLHRTKVGYTPTYAKEIRQWEASERPAPDWDPAEHRDVPGRMKQLDEVRATCPVAYANRAGGMFAVMKYEDLVKVARDPKTFSNDVGTRYTIPTAPLENDPPEHKLYRDMLQPFFTAPRMGEMEVKMRRTAADLLAPLLERGEGDLAKEYSYPFPVLGLCYLLQLPEDGRESLKSWSEDTLLRDSDDPEERERALVGHEKIMLYARTVIKERLVNPQVPETDITSALLVAEINGKPIDKELIAMILRLLIAAGHNSTTSALGNSLLYLAGHIEEQQRLRANPSLIPAAIEEMLRIESPVQEMPRRTTADCVIRGRPIPMGPRIAMFWGSGNRDEDQFSEPDQCRLDRRPNPHLAFGYGIHKCLGAPMARMELKVAMEEMLSRSSHFEIAGEVIHPGFHRMGVASLPVRLTAAKS